MHAKLDFDACIELKSVKSCYLSTDWWELIQHSFALFGTSIVMKQAPQPYYSDINTTVL